MVTRLIFSVFFSWLGLTQAQGAPTQLDVTSVPEPYFYSLSQAELKLVSRARTFSIPRRKCNAGQIALFLSQLHAASRADLKLPIPNPPKQMIAAKEDGKAYAIPRHSRYGRFLADIPERLSTLRLESRNKCQAGK